MASPIDPTTFRSNTGTAFVDASKYTDAQVNFYITLAYTMMNAPRWGALLDAGATLFVAHWLALAALAASGGADSVPGVAVGVLTGGTVDKVSYTKDVTTLMDKNAGHWGMTIYGMQYWQMVKMVGAGPIQIGIGPDVPFGWFNGAWPGVVYGPPF